jgi:hypothetical protein
LDKCPQVVIKGKDGTEISALLDSGSEINLLSGRMYQKLKLAGIELLELPVQGIVLITAFESKSRKIKTQVLLEFTIGEDKFEGVFLISQQLTNDAIIGCQFLKEYGVCLDFQNNSFNYEIDGTRKQCQFKVSGIQNESSNDQCSENSLSLQHPDLRSLDTTCGAEKYVTMSHEASAIGSDSHNKETIGQAQEESSCFSLCSREIHDIAAVMNEATLSDCPQG